MITSSDFKIGNRVLYTYRGLPNGVKSLDGLMGTIIQINGDFVGVQFDDNIKKEYGFGHDCEGYGKNGYCRYIDPPELEIIDEKPGKIKWYSKGKLSESKRNYEFNIGDRVIYTYKECYVNGMAKLNGLIGTVICFDDEFVGVEFDEDFGGHNCDGEGKSGHCRYLDPPELEIIDEKPGKIKWYSKGKLEEKIITKFFYFKNLS